MKRRILLFITVLTGIISNAQTTGSVITGAGYTNSAYYKLSTGISDVYPLASWDLAFYRVSAMAFATRVNDAISVYQASNSVANWAAIDVAQQTTWKQLYNSEIQWDKGAIDNGSATYGWGEYNMANHHVTGTIVYVLKYADGTYKKFKMDDYFGGYTFTYSSWNGTAWSADTTYVLSNTKNPNNKFNYYSLVNNAEVVAEPASTDWDFVMTKYNTDLGVMYPVTGILTHPDIQVAKNSEPGGTGDASALNYSANINSVGYNWKTFNMTQNAYEVNSDMAYYLKYKNGTIYRLVFNSFEGTGTGITTFTYQDVTSSLGTESFENKVSFGVFPNPSTDKKINLVYDLPIGNTGANTVTVFSLTGAQVYQTNIDSATGFYNTSIDLGSLNSGTYLLKFDSGSYSTVKKIILQ